MKKTIFLLSDQVVHWNIFPAANRKQISREVRGTASTKRLLEFLSAYFIKMNEDVDLVLNQGEPHPGPLEIIDPCDSTMNHAMATWKQFPEGKSKAWKIQEIVHVGLSDQALVNPVEVVNAHQADLVFIQDWGMNIRHIENPDLITALRDQRVIFRCYPPVFEGNLWHDFQKELASKKLLLLRVEDVRKLNTSISKGLSWEQTIQDILNEIYFKRAISLHPLRTAEYVILSFGCTGTLLLHNNPGSPEKPLDIILFFDSMGIEGYYERAHPGYLPGDLDLLACLLAKEILYPARDGEILLERAIRAHLLCRRAQLASGAKTSEGSPNLEVLSAELNKVYGPKLSPEFTPVTIDYSMIKNVVDHRQSKNTFPSSWSFLGLTRWDLYTLARQIALTGPMKALQGWNIPIAKFNNLLTVDRKEIEFLHHLKTLITEYLQNKSSQPLSIAVFGSPGSGKSFSIKQLAKALDLPDFEIRDITFNLSQFNEENPSELYQAYHAVRDIALSGKIPLVFWDEFDSKNLAWLRYFLAPMQDGEFQEGQLTHNIGKSIFVFAGGTCACMEEFEEKARLRIAEKGPDFLSRIKGFINVMGPNPVLPFTGDDSKCQETIEDTAQFNLAKNADPEFVIRRAILINSLMLMGYRQLFKDDTLQIDDGVLNAFLLVPKFKHGTRSIETILKTSQLFGKSKFHRSDLPPESQMNLHVDGQQFYEILTQEPKFLDGGKAFYHLVNEITFDEEIVRTMAACIHAMYTLIFSSEEGCNPLSISREQFKAVYEEMKSLPESMPQQEVSQNYHNARKIPEKLRAVGYSIVPLNLDLPAEQLHGEELERVSRLEHIRWVRHQIDAGWSFSPVKDKAFKLHDALVPWDEKELQAVEQVYGSCYAEMMGTANEALLSEYYRNIDRAVSLAIPWILEIVGYKMVRINQN